MYLNYPFFLMLVVFCLKVYQKSHQSFFTGKNFGTANFKLGPGDINLGTGDLNLGTGDINVGTADFNLGTHDLN